MYNTWSRVDVISVQFWFCFISIVCCATQCVCYILHIYNGISRNLFALAYLVVFDAQWLSFVEQTHEWLLFAYKQWAFIIRSPVMVMMVLSGTQNNRQPRSCARNIYFFSIIKVRYPISPKRICICDKLLTATNCSFVSSTLGYRARQLMYLKLKNLIIERNNRAGNFVLSAHIV